MLQLIVSPAARFPEYEMPLNKILCGLDLPDPLALDFKPSEPEKANAETLLRSAIQAWPKVAGTSLEGFRNSFLLRRGRLTHAENKWQLLVEKRGYDVLLTTIPWGFGIIKHSWMPTPVYVEWI